jgi:RNA polymerase sigma-70 factor (ECF subfamily)
MAFEELHRAYRSRIHRYLIRLLGPADAEDVTQLVFLRASQALPEFRGASSVGTWLYRIARNAAMDWQRSRSRAAAAREAVSGGRGTVAESAPEALPPADEALVRREMQQCLRGIIDSLPESYREVLALRELEGLPDAKVAEALGVSVGAVKVRLHRARGRLRERLTECCTFTHDGRPGFGCERKGAA